MISILRLPSECNDLICLDSSSAAFIAAAPFQFLVHHGLAPEDDVAAPRSLRLQLRPPTESSPLHLVILPNI
jgi:hypothetical protein